MVGEGVRLRIMNGFGWYTLVRGDVLALFWGQYRGKVWFGSLDWVSVLVGWLDG